MNNNEDLKFRKEWTDVDRALLNMAILNHFRQRGYIYDGIKDKMNTVSIIYPSTTAALFSLLSLKEQFIDYKIALIPTDKSLLYVDGWKYAFFAITEDGRNFMFCMNKDADVMAVDLDFKEEKTIISNFINSEHFLNNERLLEEGPYIYLFMRGTFYNPHFIYSKN